VQLARSDNGYHLWSETFDRTLDDIFEIQDDIAHAVVDKLRLGDADQAFRWLEAAVASRDPGILWLRDDPLPKGLTGDSRYAALLRTLNLPQPENR